MLKNEEEKYKQKRENPGKRKGNLQAGDFFVFFIAQRKKILCVILSIFPGPTPPFKKKKSPDRRLT